MLSELERKFIIEEFKDFKPEPGFKGGCIKGKILGSNGEWICARLNQKGEVVEIQKPCKEQNTCKGKDFKFFPK